MRFKSFSLDVIDFIGIMVPGIIWTLLAFSLHTLYPDVLSNEYSVVSSAIGRVFPENALLVNAFGFLFTSYLFGYLSRLIPTGWLDWLTLPLASFGTGQEFSKVWKTDRKERLSPYNFLFRDQKEVVEKYLKKVPAYVGTSDYVKTFYLSRRLLLYRSPPLWENARRREAEIRLINGLFYVSATLAIIFLFRGSIRIGVFFALIAPFLAFTFRRRRYAEASFIYSSSFIVLLDQGSRTKSPVTST